MPVPGHNATAVVTHAAEDGLTGEFLVGQLVSLESFQCSSNSCDVGVEIRLSTLTSSLLSYDPAYGVKGDGAVSMHFNPCLPGFPEDEVVLPFLVNSHAFQDSLVT